MNKILLVIVVLISSTALSFGQDLLSYDEYMKIIEAKLPDLQKTLLAVRDKEYDLKKSYSVYDIQSSASVYGNGSQSVVDNENSDYTYTPGFGAEASIAQTLPSGTRISAGFTYSQTYSGGENTSTNIVTGAESSSEWTKVSYDPVLTVGITQPLLNNWFGFLDRYSIKNAQNELQIEKLEQELNRESYVKSYKKLYFQWIGITIRLDLLQKTIANARQLLQQTRQKFQVGLVEEDSVKTAEYALLNYQNQYQAALYEYAQVKNQLLFFIDIDSVQPDLTFFQTRYTGDYEAQPLYLDFDETKNAAILNLTRENIELLKKARVNQSYPTLNLFANVNFNFHYASETVDEETTTYSFTDNESKNINFTAGIEFSVKLGNISARNDIQKANIMVEEIIIQYESTKLIYDTNLQNVLGYHSYTKNILEINQSSLATLMRKYTVVNDKYTKGLATLQDLTDTDNLITTEQINRIQYRVNLINNLIDYEYLTEQ